MSDENSNIVHLRPRANGERHPYEIVEIMRYSMAGPEVFWVSLGGPYSAPAGSATGGRKPYDHVATFPISDVAGAIDYVGELAADFNIRIVDLAEVLPPETDSPL